MSKVQTQLHTVQQVLATGVIDQSYDIHREYAIRVVTEDFNVGNIIELQVKLFEQTNWTILESLTGDEDKSIDISTYDEFRAVCTTYNPLGFYPSIIVSAFLKKPLLNANSLQFNVPNGDNVSVQVGSPLTYQSTDGSITMTGDDGSDSIDFIVSEPLASRVRVSSNDTVSRFLGEKLTTSTGVNTTDIVELNEINDGADETLDIKVDETKIDHNTLKNYTSTEHFTMLDEDDMISDSNTQASTQQSIKKFVEDGDAAVQLNLTNHINDTSNPHSVDYSDIRITTTKGDMVVDNGITAERLPVGIDGQVIEADSNESTGIKWVDQVIRYTDEEAQDTVGSILTDTSSIDFTYDDVGNTISAIVLPAGVDHNSLSNTHNLTTDIDHDQLTNTHNLTTDIDHDTLTNYTVTEHFTMLDEDDMTSDSDTQAATQQSIKKYVDTNITALVDQHVRTSNADTTSGYLDDKLDIVEGANTTNIIESFIVNPSGNEILTYQFDETKIDHGSISGLLDDDHTQYVLKGAAYIPETSAVLQNNQSSETNLLGFSVSHALSRSFTATIRVEINATLNTYELFEIKGLYTGSDWTLGISSIGDDSGVNFTITNVGQLQYTTTNNAGFVSATAFFEAATLSS